MTRRSRVRSVAAIVLLVAIVILNVLPAAADDTPTAATAAAPEGVVIDTPTGAVEVSAAIHSDISPALRDIPPEPGDAAEALRSRPVRMTGIVLSANNQPDGAIQTTPAPEVNATGGLSFAGVGQGDYGFNVQYAPPDTNMAVGSTQIVQWVNVQFAVFDKATGAKVYGPVNGNTLWAGFGGGCETNNDGDPIVQYDALANRWIMTQFSVSTTPYLQCVAVSTTSDATGSYYRYAFSYGNTQFNDYPKMGVWPDGYYITYNIFNNGSTFAGAKACAFDRNAMLNGQAATQQCFQTSTAYGSLLPADLDGTTVPPAGSPNYMVSFGTNSLLLWKFKVDWATPANTTFTGPQTLSVSSFTPACNGGGACIPQKGTKQKLDSLADRLMYRFAYRNRGGTESLVVNNSVTAGNVVGIRWYELRVTNGAISVAQQSTYSPDANYRWMGSLAMDKAGNMALGYSKSSTQMYPSIFYTGRQVTDAANTLQAETQIKAGDGAQSGNRLSRWGDYSAMRVDPVDGCTFWFTTEYLKATGSFNWSTWIYSFKFPNCQ